MVEVANRRVLWLWQPRSLTWWVATLFMIGSCLFMAGSILFLQGFSNVYLNGLVFFIGSLFFTSAAYGQFYQSINTQGSRTKLFAWQANSLVFNVAVAQFMGTILFNINTFDALFELGWLAQDLLIWCPDIIGSILFQISGSLGIIAMHRRGLNVRIRGVSWWIGIVNFTGCVAFLLSACLAFVLPQPVAFLSVWSNVFTLIGALCFFVAAYLMWQELNLTKSVA